MKLRARQPWHLAVQVHKAIGFLDSPGEHPDWKIYWISGVSMLRTIGQVLDKSDRHTSDLLHAIITDHWKSSNFKKWPIFKEFIDAERNSLLKLFDTKVAITPHTTSRFFGPKLSYAELVKRNGEFQELSWEPDGDDALRLYEIALVTWHEELCVIEQAIRERCTTPFSSPSSVRYDLLDRSDFVETVPETPRL